FIYLAAHAVQSNWNYFTMYVFNWSEKQVGLSLAIVGVLVGAVQGGLIRFINPKLGDEKTTYLGLFLYAVGLTLFAFATESWMMYVFLIPYCLGGIAGPALQSIITKHVPANEQGQLQGSLTSLMSLTAVFGPLIMTSLFTYTTREDSLIHLPGAPFLLGALFMVVSIVIAWKVLHRQKKEKEELAAVPESTAESENIPLYSRAETGLALQGGFQRCDGFLLTTDEDLVPDNHRRSFQEGIVLEDEFPVIGFGKNFV